MDVDIIAAENEISIKGGGNLFGGTFSVETAASVDSETTVEDLFGQASETGTGLGSDQTFSTESNQQLGLGSKFNLIIKRVNLAQIAALIPGYSRRVAGYVTGVVRGQLGTDSPVDIELLLEYFEVDNQLVSRRIRAELQLNDNTLDVQRLRGIYAGGRVDAAGDIQLFPTPRGRLNVRLSSVDFDRGLFAISPEASEWVGGAVSGSLNVELADSLSIRGTVTVRENEIFEIATGESHANLKVGLSRDFRRWFVNLWSIEGSLGRGRLSGNLRLSSSTRSPGAIDMTSSWRAQRLDFADLLGDFSGSNRFARGELDGELTLGGTAIRSVADLNGRFAANLGGTQARAVPGLLSAQAYLGAFSLTGATFDAGRIRGDIASGTLLLNEMWLISDQARVWADGRVGLATGRLDIDAVIQTGSFEAQNLALLSLAELVALPTGVPIGAIVQLNRLASNRTIYIDVLGPISRPRVRLKPIEILRENLARLAVQEAAATVLPFTTTSPLIPLGADD